MSTTTFAVRDQGKKGAILLVHGFGGESHTTFGMMPAFLAGSPALLEWDIHCFGYPTTLSPDLTGVWAADPDLTTLAGFLTTALEQLTFQRYEEMVLVGHSMGGLIIQRALLDGKFQSRIRQVVLFGTPSNGLNKAWWGKLFKRQARDMDRDGEFIARLRRDWKEQIGDHPSFAFKAVAGIRDEFVPRESSVDVFPREHQAFINGNHLEMVKPESALGDAMELLHTLLGPPRAAQAKPAKARPMPKRMKLGEKETEELVYSLEASGREGEAIELLEGTLNLSTNLTGVLAGRLKRRWFADPETRAADGRRAKALYSEAYRRASAAGDDEQAFYNGINDAFLALALEQNPEEARATAERVVSHTARAKGARWARATEGEACLYLGDTAAAMLAYAEAAQQEWTPRERDSIKRQAIWAARLMNNVEAEQRLESVLNRRA